MPKREMFTPENTVMVLMIWKLSLPPSHLGQFMPKKPISREEDHCTGGLILLITWGMLGCCYTMR